jgi:hypothetical protein
MVNICLQRFCVKLGSDDWRLSNPVGGCGMGVIFKNDHEMDDCSGVDSGRSKHENYTPLRRCQASW